MYTINKQIPTGTTGSADQKHVHGRQSYFLQELCESRFAVTRKLKIQMQTANFEVVPFGKIYLTSVNEFCLMYTLIKFMQVGS